MQNNNMKSCNCQVYIDLRKVTPWYLISRQFNYLLTYLLTYLLVQKLSFVYRKKLTLRKFVPT